MRFRNLQQSPLSTVARIISSQNIYKHHIVEIRGGVTDAGQPNEVKIELLSHWKLSFAKQSPLSPDTNKRKYVHCLLLLHVSNGSMYQFCLRMLKPHINRYFVLAVPAYRFRQGWWGQPLRSGQAVRYILTTSQSL